MTSSETRWKRLIAKWTAPKGFTGLVLFFLLTLFVEFLLVYIFQSFGLVDLNAWAATFSIPYVNWSFTVSVSPLFHLLPLSVILVLLSSWVYLKKYAPFVPQRVGPSRRVAAPTQRGQERLRFKSLRQFLKRLDRRLQRVGRTLKAGVKRIPGVSYVSQRLSFTHAAVRSATLVLVVFLCLVFLLLLVEYPDLIYKWALNLHRFSPALSGFALGTAQWLRGVGQAVPPLGGLGSAMNNALIGVAIGFKRSLEGAGTYLTRPIVQLDLVGKYVLSQNVAAWTAALVALIYGAYASLRPQRRPKRR